MTRYLVTGALGQIGSELVALLRKSHGPDAVVATDIRQHSGSEGPFELLDVTDASRVSELLHKHQVTHVVHLAAMLSATGEAKPQLAWHVNMGGLLAILEGAREHGAAVFTPSSIAAFGPSTPTFDTPQQTIQRPTSIYGVTKVAGELLCDYYFTKFGVDTRGVRFPGLISYATPPGGGTTDYAVEIFEHAILSGTYTCFLKPDTRLDMMYMPDALDAVVQLINADPSRLIHRNAFNVTAMSFTPAELANAIQQVMPSFSIAYDVDPVRQQIADSWPDRMDDSAARAEWDWNPRFTLEAMVADMLEQTEKRLKSL